jgi:hypothetical protein
MCAGCQINASFAINQKKLLLLFAKKKSGANVGEINVSGSKFTKFLKADMLDYL